ncbi:MAG: hypothetical protein KBT46_01515 [Ruminococcus sp.]|nr:hypothetical protein [Candidatus Copronaster equi]
MDKYFVGLGSKQNDYIINGVRYIVASKFMPFENSVTLTDKVEKYLDSDFADLTDLPTIDKLTDDYVCSTVRKEDK